MVHQLIRPNLFLLFILCLLSSFSSNATKILDVQDDARLVADNDCELNFFFRVNMALPQDHNYDDLLPMFLAYDIEDGPSGQIAIDPLEFQNYGQNIQGVTILEYRLPISMFVWGGCQGEDYYFPDYQTRLLAQLPTTSTGPSFIDYPVYNYMQNGSFFPCEIFDLSFGQQIPPPGCNIEVGDYPSMDSGELEIKCKVCQDYVGESKGGILNYMPNTEKVPPVKDGGYHGEDNDQDGGDHDPPFHHEAESVLNDLQILPNPFRNELTIPFSLKEESDLQVRIFDATGKIMHQENRLQAFSDDQIYLDTNNWPAGIYYAQVKTQGFSQSYRLVKID